MQLPQSYRDPGFQRHISRLARAEQIYGRDSAAWRAVLAEPWVKDAPFDPQRETHCPRGHVGQHLVEHPSRTHDGRPHTRRCCTACSSTWLEPMP